MMHPVDVCKSLLATHVPAPWAHEQRTQGGDGSCAQASSILSLTSAGLAPDKAECPICRQVINTETLKWHCSSRGPAGDPFHHRGARTSLRETDLCSHHRFSFPAPRTSASTNIPELRECLIYHHGVATQHLLPKEDAFSEAVICQWELGHGIHWLYHMLHSLERDCLIEGPAEDRYGDSRKARPCKVGTCLVDAVSSPNQQPAFGATAPITGLQWSGNQGGGIGVVLLTMTPNNHQKKTCFLSDFGLVASEGYFCREHIVPLNWKLKQSLTLSYLGLLMHDNF